MRYPFRRVLGLLLLAGSTLLPLSPTAAQDAVPPDVTTQGMTPQARACTAATCLHLPLVIRTTPRSQAAGTVVTTQAVADARVRADMPNTNFGSSRELTSDGWPQTHETLLRFRVSDVGTISKAVLRLYGREDSLEVPDVALSDEPWNEATVTWPTRPAITEPTIISKRGTFAAGTWTEIDVTRLIRSEGDWTLVLTTVSGDKAVFDSREGANPPQLVIIPGDAPAPAPVPAPTPDPDLTTGDTYYVDPDGSGDSPRSRSGAWQRLSDIEWSRIDPGDTIQIARATYYESLYVQADGSADNPIRLVFAPGTVLHGGRSGPLKDCGGGSVGGARRVGLDGEDAAYVVIDGQERDGLTIRSFERGIELNAASHHLTFRNLAITDNGTMEGGDPTGRGVNLAGRNIRFERLNIHDNGHDAFQATDQHIADILFREVWFHNSTLDNGCAHPDAVQINGETPDTTAMRFERSVFGPGIYHNFLQQKGDLDGLSFVDVLSFDPLTSAWAIRGIAARDVVFERVTSDTDRSLHAEISAATDVTITDSIFTGGDVWIPVATRLSNNIRWGTGGDSIGSSRDPRYRNPEGFDYTPTADVGGAGSRVNERSDMR